MFASPGGGGCQWSSREARAVKTSPKGTSWTRLEARHPCDCRANHGTIGHGAFAFVPLPPASQRLCFKIYELTKIYICTVISGLMTALGLWCAPQCSKCLECCLLTAPTWWHIKAFTTIFMGICIVFHMLLWNLQFVVKFDTFKWIFCKINYCHFDKYSAHMSWSSDVCIYIKIFMILVGNGKLKGGKELPKQNFTRKLLLLEDKMKKTKKQIQKHRKRIQRHIDK